MNGGHFCDWKVAVTKGRVLALLLLPSPHWLARGTPGFGCDPVKEEMRPREPMQAS